jgi:hypothetical protein
MPGRHELSDGTMAPFVGKEPWQWPALVALRVGLDKLRRCVHCQNFLEPGYATQTICEYAPAADVSTLSMTFFPEPK